MKASPDAALCFGSRLLGRFAWLFIVFATCVGTASCRWTREEHPKFRTASSADSLALFSEEIDPGPEVTLRAGHGFFSDSSLWLELTYAPATVRGHLVSGILSPEVRAGFADRPLRIVAACDEPAIFELRLLSSDRNVRSVAFAVPGGMRESVHLLTFRDWRLERPEGRPDTGKFPFAPERFEVRGFRSGAEDAPIRRIRMTLPALVAPDRAPEIGTLPAPLQELVTPEDPRRNRVEAAWRAYCLGTGLGKFEESQTRLLLSNTKTPREHPRAELDSALALGPTPETSSAIATLVACIDCPRTVPEVGHLSETFAARLLPSYMPAALQRAVAHHHSGIPAKRAALAFLEGGPAFDEDTSQRPRAILWGLLFPGDPYRAAAAASRDASLSHSGEGLDDARYAAALVAGALASPPPRLEELLDLAESFLTDNSPAEEAVLGTRQVWHRTRSLDSCSAWADTTASRRTKTRLPGSPWSHALANLPLVPVALEAGDGDWGRTIRIATSFGQDADANAALCGAVVGALNGLDAIPEEYLSPTFDVFRAAVVGAENWRQAHFASCVVAVSLALEFDPTDPRR